MKRNLLIALAAVALVAVAATAVAFNSPQQATDDEMSNALSHRAQPGHVVPPLPGSR
jgi:hypothetical protein